MQAQLQRIEIKAVRSCDDNLTVDYATLRQRFQQSVVQLGKVTIERAQIPALDEYVCAFAKHDGAESIPFWFIQILLSRRQHISQLGQHRLYWPPRLYGRAVCQLAHVHALWTSRRGKCASSPAFASRLVRIRNVYSRFANLPAYFA